MTELQKTDNIVGVYRSHSSSFKENDSVLPSTVVTLSVITDA